MRGRRPKGEAGGEPSSAFVRSAHDEDRAPSSTDDALRNRADRGAAETGTAVGAHHDHVAAELRCEASDLGRRIAAELD